MKTIILVVFFLYAITSLAQQTRSEISEIGVFGSEYNGKAKIYLNQDAKLKEIIISKSKAKKTIYKWSVMIYKGSDRNSRATAASTRNAFVARYPDVPAKMEYPSPNWKVYVGEFDKRIEAESFKHKIREEYQNSRVELITISTN